MALSTTVTATTKTEIKLAPSVRKKLETKLRAYENLALQIKSLDAQRKKLAEELGELRDQTGETSLKLEGFGTITLIASTYKKFNEKRFIALGGDIELYRQANEDKPRKPYNKITLSTPDSDEEFDE